MALARILFIAVASCSANGSHQRRFDNAACEFDVFKDHLEPVGLIQRPDYLLLIIHFHVCHPQRLHHVRYWLPSSVG